MRNDLELEHESAQYEAPAERAYAEPPCQDILLREGGEGWAAGAVQSVEGLSDAGNPEPPAPGGKMPSGSSQSSVVGEKNAVVGEPEPKPARDRSVTPTYGRKPNLSKAEIAHLIAVAGDHLQPEAEWMRACHLLGDYTHRPSQRATGRMIAAGLAFLLLAGSGVGLFLYFQNSQLEPTIATAPPAAPVAAPDYSSYMAHLQRRIKRHWFPPKSDITKREVVQFKILRDGTMDDVQIIQSAGDASDRAALSALEQAAPFRPLPAGSSPDVTIQFTFDYNVFNQKSKLPKPNNSPSASSDTVAGNGSVDAFSSTSRSSSGDTGSRTGSGSAGATN